MNYKLRFLLALLIEWPLCLLVSGVFTLLSAILVPLAWFFGEPVVMGRLGWRVYSAPYGDGRRIRAWRWEPLMYPWGNEEDGIDGLPTKDGVPFKNQWWRDKTAGWSDFRRVFTWCVLRNSASNLRFMPVTGYKINPSKLRLGWNEYYPDMYAGALGTYKGRSWFMWEGWRSNLYFEWNGVHFWIGWPQKPEDLPDWYESEQMDTLPQTLPIDDTRAPGVSFKLQIRRSSEVATEYTARQVWTARAVLIALGLLVAWLLVGCTDAPKAQRAAEAQGLQNVKITGYRFFGCDDGDDVFHTGFEARGPNGQQVSGIVCSGWLKGATVRYD